MNNLFITVGVPGSGKSTFCKSVLYPGAHYVSRDKIRFSLLNDNDDYFSKETEVFNKFVESICVGLRAGVDVVADATHITPASRTKLLRAVCRKLPQDLRFRTVYLYFTASLGECLDRNELRTGREYVPESAIKKMWRDLVRPTADEIAWTGYIVDIHGN